MSWGVGIALGMGVGVAMGVATQNMGVGIGVGIAIGLVFAIAVNGAPRRPKAQPDDATPSDDARSDAPPKTENPDSDR